MWDSTEVYLQQETSIYTTRQSRHRSHSTWHIFPQSPILDLQVHTVWHRREGRQTVRMRSAGWRPLGGSLPTSLSIPLELSPYSAAGTLRHRLCLGECLEATTSEEQNFWRVRYNREGQPIWWLSTGIVQGSVLRILIYYKGDWTQNSRRILSYIIVCGYDTTHL